MGLTPVTGHAAGIGKTATMTARINISTIQAAGVYRNIFNLFCHSNLLKMKKNKNYYYYLFKPLLFKPFKEKLRPKIFP